jgi:hypothetical protein
MKRVDAALAKLADKLYKVYLTSSGRNDMGRIILIAVALTAISCGGGNPYGYAREYAPLSNETPFYEHAETVPYEEVRRDPTLLRGKLLGWFGVVTGIEKKALADGRARLSLTLRFHQSRHLCENQFESSCRVTVSERTGGPFSALVMIRPEDSEGKTRVYQGSLLKIYGVPNGEYDDEGGPIIEVRFYRHWPPGTYVTTAWQGSLRR